MKLIDNLKPIVSNIRGWRWEPQGTIRDVIKILVKVIKGIVILGGVVILAGLVVGTTALAIKSLFIPEFIPNFWDVCLKATPDKKALNCSEVVRNFGWMVWMFVSILGAMFGLLLAWRGREIQRKQWETQHESHLLERLEKITDMLYEPDMQVRIHGCLFLKSLALKNPSMKFECLDMLFNVIRHPYLDEKKRVAWEKQGTYTSRELYLLKEFPIGSSLRADITEAIKSFSAIFAKLGSAGESYEIKLLPQYFWQNVGQGDKPTISIINADLECPNLDGAELDRADLRFSNLYEAFLREAQLEHADLEGVNLENANLWDASLYGANLKNAKLMRANLYNVNFMDANLKGADLRWADLSGAKMLGVKNLTKKQVLSAKWKHERKTVPTRERDELDPPSGPPTKEAFGPPELPKELMQDQDEKIQEWLANPHDE